MSLVEGAVACVRISFVTRATLAVARFDPQQNFADWPSLQRGYPVFRLSRTTCFVSTSAMVWVIGLSLHIY